MTSTKLLEEMEKELGIDNKGICAQEKLSVEDRLIFIARRQQTRMVLLNSRLAVLERYVDRLEGRR